MAEEFEKTEAFVRADRLVTVFGGSGFVGRHVVRALVRRGWRVRVAVRRPDLAFHLQPLGTPGQIHAVQANLRYPESVAHALRDAQAAINLVGILRESGAQNFDEFITSARNPSPRPRNKRARKYLCKCRRLEPTLRLLPPMLEPRPLARRRCGKSCPMPSLCGPRLCLGRRINSSTDSRRWRGSCQRSR